MDLLDFEYAAALCTLQMTCLLCCILKNSNISQLICGMMYDSLFHNIFAVFALFFIFQCLTAVKFKLFHFQLGSNKACNLCPYACLYSVAGFSIWIFIYYFPLYDHQHDIFIVSCSKLVWNQVTYKCEL